MYGNTELQGASLCSNRFPGFPKRDIQWQSVTRPCQILWPRLQARRARGTMRVWRCLYWDRMGGRASPGTSSRVTSELRAGLGAGNGTAQPWQGQQLWQTATPAPCRVSTPCPGAAASQVSSPAPARNWDTVTTTVRGWGQNGLPPLLVSCHTYKHLQIEAPFNIL